jgi:hypothetical protein
MGALNANLLLGNAPHGGLIDSGAATGGLHFAAHDSFHFARIDGASIAVGSLTDEEAIDHRAGGHQAKLRRVGITGLVRFHEPLEFVSDESVRNEFAVDGDGHEYLTAGRRGED